MGFHGPKTKLPQIERLEGNPSKRPIIGDFIASTGEPFVPEHLCDEAQGCMEVIIASMPDKVYSQADTYLLAAFAKAWAMHKIAAHEIASPHFEWVVTNEETGAQKANPWIGIINQQAALMATLGDRLGLNPKARIGIRLPAEQPRNKFDGLIAQTRSSHSLSA